MSTMDSELLKIMAEHWDRVKLCKSEWEAAAKAARMAKKAYDAAFDHYGQVMDEDREYPLFHKRDGDDDGGGDGDGTPVEAPTADIVAAYRARLPEIPANAVFVVVYDGGGYSAFDDMAKKIADSHKAKLSQITLPGGTGVQALYFDQTIMQSIIDSGCPVVAVAPEVVDGVLKLLDKDDPMDGAFDTNCQWTGPLPGKTKPPTPWRDVPVRELGLSDRITIKLKDEGLATLGDIQKFAKKQQFSVILGIGEATSEKIEDAIEKWFADHPGPYEGGEPNHGNPRN